MGVAGSGVATVIRDPIGDDDGALLIYILYVDKKETKAMRRQTVKAHLDWPAIGEIFKLWNSRRGPSGLRSRRVFTRHGFGRSRGRRGPGRAHDRSEYRELHIHGSFGSFGRRSDSCVGQWRSVKGVEKANARTAGWSSFALGVGFMGCSAIFLFLFGREILVLFTRDPAVIELGRKVLVLAAIFQVFDGTQTVGTGALRGVGETRFPMFANLFGHWFVGLPIGIFLCFYHGSGIVGLWTGLTVGLIVVASAILFSWTKNTTFANAESHTPASILIHKRGRTVE